MSPKLNNNYRYQCEFLTQPFALVTIVNIDLYFQATCITVKLSPCIPIWEIRQTKISQTDNSDNNNNKNNNKLS